jgi:hypothetical protein
MSPRVVLVALAATLGVLALAGCGLEGQPFDSTEATTTAPELGDAVVTPDAISAYPPGSPEAATLRWWRAVQTRDTDAVIRSYSSQVREQLPKDFAAIVVAFISPSASQAPIAIDYVESEGGDEATVYAVISESPDWRMNGPLALPMTKDNDKWLITDATFLDALVRTSGAPPEEGSQ